MNIEQQLEVAAAARDKLEALHKTFMDAVRSLTGPKLNGAEFRCVDGEIEATCIGVELRAPHRLVALVGELELIEYTFIARDADDDVPIWSMYLSPNSSLYADPAQQNVLCDITNQYLHSRIAPHIASKLLASKIFAPRA
jgi:hypothetical protein